MQEGQQVFEILDGILLVGFDYALVDRCDEFVIILDFDHKWSQFEIQNENISLVLDC